LECKRQRLEGMLAAAGLMLKTLAVDKKLLSPAGVLQSCGWLGLGVGRPPLRTAGMSGVHTLASTGTNV